MSDISFDGEFVNVDGNWLRSRTLDFMLDAPSRRSSQGGSRRALVHNGQDGLTVNYNNDYPAGVTVSGTRTLSGFNNGDWIDVESRIVQIKGSDIMLDSAARRSNRTPYRRALVHDIGDGLTINYNGDYPSGVAIQGRVQMPAGATVEGTDVKVTFRELFDEIALLRGRIEALEAG